MIVKCGVSFIQQHSDRRRRQSASFPLSLVNIIINSLRISIVLLCGCNWLKALLFIYYSRPSTMAAEEGALSGGLGAKLKCPTPISRLRVEKIEGGLMVAGVVIAANCQIALPAFGFLFMLVGAVLTGLYLPHCFHPLNYLHNIDILYLPALYSASNCLLISGQSDERQILDRC